MIGINEFEPEQKESTRRVSAVERFVNLARPRPYVAGAIACACAISLIQDFYGLEGYVEHLRAHWISGWYTVPIAVVGFLWAVFCQDKEGS